MPLFSTCVVHTKIIIHLGVGVGVGVSYRAPVAQLVEHRAVTREVVSSTPAGPSLRVLK